MKMRIKFVEENDATRLAHVVLHSMNGGHDVDGNNKDGLVPGAQLVKSNCDTVHGNDNLASMSLQQDVLREVQKIFEGESGTCEFSLRFETGEPFIGITYWQEG